MFAIDATSKNWTNKKTFNPTCNTIIGKVINRKIGNIISITKKGNQWKIVC
jgi:hypothetical protein